MAHVTFLAYLSTFLSRGQIVCVCFSGVNFPDQVWPLQKVASSKRHAWEASVLMSCDPPGLDMSVLKIQVHVSQTL